MTNLDDLTKLAKLRDDGVLTDEEFAAQKALLLSGAGDTKGSSAPWWSKNAEWWQDPAKRRLWIVCVVIFVVPVIYAIQQALAPTGGV